MRFACLGSGSRGNALVVEKDHTRLMLDCGYPVREIERHAQRGGELLKRLQRQLVPVSSPEGAGDGEFCGQGPGSPQGPAQGPAQGLTPRHGGAEAQEPGVVTARQANLPPAAPGFSLPE